MGNFHRDNKVVIGSRSTPLPMWDDQNQLMSALASEADKIHFPTTHQDQSRSGAPDVVSEDDRITVQDRVYAELMRLLPTRSMLPELKRILEKMDPHRHGEKRSMVTGLVGGSSTGKSFMCKSIARLKHPKGGLYVKCTGMDLGELFCETVLDVSSAHKEIDALNAKLLLGNQDASRGLKPENIDLLKRLLGSAFIMNAPDPSMPGTRPAMSIDWSGIRIQGKTIEEQDRNSRALTRALVEILRDEGIDVSSQSNTLGVTTRDGILIRSADPSSADYGRIPILDEINTEGRAGRHSTMPKLYEFMAMLVDPRVQECTVTGGQNRRFTFHRQDLLDMGYHLFYTGNPPTPRYPGRREFDAAWMARVGHYTNHRIVPEAQQMDFTDRIAQNLTGVPLAQIYYSAQAQFDRHPEVFAKELKAFRLDSLTDAERRYVPEEEVLNVNDAQRILQLSEQLAQFFEELKQIVNPDSSYHRENHTNLSPEYAQYLAGIPIDLRLAELLITDASQIEASLTPSAQVDYSARHAARATESTDAPEIDLDDRLATRGDRLEKYLLRWMKQVLIPGDAGTRGIDLDEAKNLYALACKQAANCGIGVPQVGDVQDGSIQSVKDLYNFHRMREPAYRAEKLKELAIDTFIEANPEFESYRQEMQAQITPESIQRAQRMQEESRARLPKGVSVITVVNTNPDQFIEAPFVQVFAKDAVPVGEESVFEPAPHALVRRNALLAGFAAAEKNQEILPSLWSQALAVHTEPSDESVQVAQHTSTCGVGVTTIMVQHHGAAEPLHVIHDKQSQQVIIIGGCLESKTRKVLERNGITYVDYSAPHAAAIVNTSVDAMLGGRRDHAKLIEQMKGAFLLRNGFDEEQERNWACSLGELMTDPHTVPPIMPIYVTELQSLDQLTHLEAELNRHQTDRHRAGEKS